MMENPGPLVMVVTLRTPLDQVARCSPLVRISADRSADIIQAISALLNNEQKCQPPFLVVADIMFSKTIIKSNYA